MAKISALPVAAAITGAENVPVLQDGILKKTPFAALEAKVAAASPYADGASRRAPLAIGDANPTGSRGALIVDRGGLTRATAFTGRTINGVNGDALVRGRHRFMTTVPADVIVLNCDGQSLMQDAVAGIFPSPPGRNYCFLRNKDNPTQADILPFNTADSLQMGSGCRMAGSIWMLRQLLLEEDGIPYDAQPIIVVANNAIGSTFFNVHLKDSDPYKRAIQQAVQARLFGRAAGLRARHAGMNWALGETDSASGNPAQAHCNALIGLAENYAADFRTAYPEQEFLPKLLTYQTLSGIPSATRYGIGRAQFMAAIARPDIISFSSSIYHLRYPFDIGEYADRYQNNAGGIGGGALHPDELGAIRGGGYEGLTRKRQLFDGAAWLPMQLSPDRGFEVEGNSAFLTYLVRGDNLTINVKDIAPLPNFGAGVRDNTTRQLVPFARPPRIVGSRIGGGLRTICLTFDQPPSPNWRYEMGLAPCPELYPYKGGATNFTDDNPLIFRAINERMFDPMPAHAFVQAANAAGFRYTLEP